MQYLHKKPVRICVTNYIYICIALHKRYTEVMYYIPIQVQSNL